MICNLAVFRERGSRNRDAIHTNLGVDHATHGATTTATRTEVRTDSVSRVSVTSFLVGIALAAVQPVEHHDREFLDRAVAQNAGGVFCVNAGFAFLVALDPNGIAEGGHGVELDFGRNGGFSSRKTIRTDKVAADGLLKVNSKVFGGGLDSRNEPSAVVVQRNHGRRGAVYIHLRVGVGPRRKEGDNLHAFANDDIATRIVFTRVVRSIAARRIVAARNARINAGASGSTATGERPGTIVRNGDSCLLRSRIQFVKRHSVLNQAGLAGFVGIDVEFVVRQYPTTINVEPQVSREPCAFFCPSAIGIVINSVVKIAFKSSCKRIRRRESRGDKQSEQLSCPLE